VSEQTKNIAANSSSIVEPEREAAWLELTTDLRNLARRRCELLGTATTRDAQASRNTAFRIAVVGAPKAGKTCILNSLIGSAVLPMPVVPAAGGPIWLKWGEHAKAVLYGVDGSTRDLVISDLESSQGPTPLSCSGRCRCASKVLSS
jgi:hypothetical protein